MTPSPHAPQHETQITFLANGRSRHLVQPLLIATLVTAMFLGIWAVLRQFVPDLPWTATTLFLFFVSLEGVYTTLWLYHPNRRTVTRLDYRAAEVVFLILCTRLYTWVISPAGLPAPADLLIYLRYPLLVFDDLLFIFLLLAALLAWVITLTYANLMNELAVSQGEVTFYSLPVGEQKVRLDQRPLHTNRIELSAHLATHWVWGGTFLIVCAAFSTFDLPQSTLQTLFSHRTGLSNQMLWLLLLYFLTGFVLLSQARLAVLNARWLADGVQKLPALEKNWHRYNIWLVVAVAVGAAFLPIGTTWGIGRLLELLILLLLSIAGFFVTFFMGLLALLLSILSPTIPNDTQPQPTPFDLGQLLPPEPTPTPPVTSDLGGIVFSSLFWAVAIVMSITAVLFFLRDRGVTLNRSLLLAIWHTFRQWWHGWWQGVSAQAHQLRQNVQKRWKRPFSPTLPAPPWRFIRLNALSPREQIRYFYLAAVRRANEQGVSRQPAETPLEFTQTLKDTWPEAETDVDTLTDAFLRARYTPQPIEKQEVSPVKEGWQRVKSTLRRKK